MNARQNARASAIFPNRFGNPSSTSGGTVAFSHRAGHETGMTSSSASAFAGFRFPREVISVAVRWYLRYGLSYRDVEELLTERGVDVDHVTIYRWGATIHTAVRRSGPASTSRAG